MTWWLDLVHFRLLPFDSHETQRQTQSIYISLLLKTILNSSTTLEFLIYTIQLASFLLWSCLVCSSLACWTAVTSANGFVALPVQWREQLSLHFCLDFRQTRNYFTWGSGSSSLKLIAVKDAQRNASKKPARCRYHNRKPVLLYWS